ncbi:MAG: glycosyltransferase [Acidimicrobiales bacterium]
MDHAFFAPGDRAGARAALGLGDDAPILLFVGRIQPRSRLTLAVEVLALLDDPDAALVVVGGPSGTQGEAELAEALAIAAHERARPKVRHPAAAASPPVDLLPRRRRGAGAEPFRVVRLGRVGGRRLRHPGGGRCGRRVDTTIVEPGRTGRAGRGRRRRRLRRRGGADPGRPGAGGRAGCGGGAQGEHVHLVDDGRPPAPRLRRPGGRSPVRCG